MQNDLPPSRRRADSVLTKQRWSAALRRDDPDAAEAFRRAAAVRKGVAKSSFVAAKSSSHPGCSGDPERDSEAGRQARKPNWRA